MMINRGKGPQPKTERNARVALAVKNGVSMVVVAGIFGISSERVRQIYRREYPHGR